eukprot:scaffold17327_cov67-Attheya_sp.AAC.11
MALLKTKKYLMTPQSLFFMIHYPLKIKILPIQRSMLVENVSSTFKAVVCKKLIIILLDL